VAYTEQIAPSLDGIKALPETVKPGSRLRVLVLGPDCNPEEVSIPLVTYSHAAALSQLHDVTLVARSSVSAPLRRSKAPFRAIEVVSTPFLDRVYSWFFRKVFKSNYESQALTAFKYPFTVAFEFRAWRQLRRPILAGEFDVVLRLVPITAVLPSPFAYLMRKGRTPFVIGPISGGLPWPPGFSQLEKQKEWISGLRKVYLFLPFAKSTYRYATAIIAASSQTFGEFSAYRDKLFFVPENAIDPSVCSGDRRTPKPETKLELIFVGGLVPRKACDLAIRGAVSLLRNNLARFTVIGDGPERARLEQLVKSLGVEDSVTFCGWLKHSEAVSQMRSADVFVFPSVRDFGGGVVFEALASGAVPVVVDFGGPGDTVYPEVGFKIPFTNENDVVTGIEKVLSKLASDRDLLIRLRERGMAYAAEGLTWEAKARSTTSVLNWAIGRGQKPDLVPPKKMLQVEEIS
jgi:glycosyltransferase involved in cell wall biosynthesis